MAIFPESMMANSSKASGGEFTLEAIAAKLMHYQTQIHLLHWQTSSYAEHQALGELYDYIHDFKDDVVEKLMGYMGKRPTGIKVEAVQSNTPASAVVNELCTYAYNLCEWASSQHYSDVENLAQELSGRAAKTKYLLTLS